MADLNKRAKKARKHATKRAKTTRKAVEKTSTRTRAQAGAAVAVFFAAVAATRRLLKRRKRDDATYSTEPDGRPNTPDRPANVTAVPTAG